MSGACTDAPAVSVTGRTGTENSAPDGDAGFGIYVHWPFCLAKCPYCDFNSHVRETVDQDRWRAALLTELAHYAARTPGRCVTSLFFGGGTPSLMPPATAGAVIDAVHRHWPVAADVEITLEANPAAAEVDRFRAFRDAGVGRVSIGVQSLEDAALRRLGRQHDAAQARAAIDRASTVFPRYSFDLIYARPGQSLADWETELDTALGLADGHLSVYQLTVEPGTAFEGQARRGELALPDEDTGADLYEFTQARLAEAGLPAYEISNHAAPGLECRHNLTYWRYEDYVGVGPGAHGRLTAGGARVATRQHRAPEAWLERVERDGHATRTDMALSPADSAAECLMMGMRTVGGIDLARPQAAGVMDAIDRQALARLVELGFVEATETRLRATAPGLQRLNAVLAALLADG